jgi:hypothetical protein
LAGKNFFYLFKTKIIYNFMIFVATKNGSNKFFPLLLLVLLLDPGSEIQDPESGMDKNQHPGCHPGSSTLLVSHYH